MNNPAPRKLLASRAPRIGPTPRGSPRRPRQSSEPIDGSVLSINLPRLLQRDDPYSAQAQNLRQTMTETTTLTEMKIFFNHCKAFVVQDHDGFVPFLLRYIGSDQNPSLCKLTLCSGSQHSVSYEGTFELVLHQLIMAAAHSKTIEHLCLEKVTHLPIRILVEFLRAQRNVKILDMGRVHNITTDLNLQQDISELFSSPIVLEKLSWTDVTFRDPPAARAFRSLVSRLEIYDIHLGFLQCDNDDTGSSTTLSIVSSLFKSSVRRLSIRNFHPEVFSRILAAGTSTVEELSFLLPPFRDSPIGELFGHVITALPKMPKLKIIRIGMRTWRGRYPIIEDETKRQFLRAVNESSTLTKVHVDDDGGGNSFTPQEIQELQARTERNRSLHRLVRNPENFSVQERLDLVKELNSCPSGLFEIVRHGFKDYCK